MNIAVFGATGSVGQQVIDVAIAHNININIISCHLNTDVVIDIINKLGYKPIILCTHPKGFNKLHNLYKDYIVSDIQTCFKKSEYINDSKIDISFVAVPGIYSLHVAYQSCIFAYKVAIASKESIICGWSILKKFNEKIIPIDSEHNALYKLMRLYKDYSKVMITASGGALFNMQKQNDAGNTDQGMQDIKLEDVLKHPTWNMGRVITINSATLANKGLEVIEAAKIFNIDPANIDVVIHPQSIVHAAVYNKNGSVIAELYNPSMKIPIMHAMGIEHDNSVKSVNFGDLAKLDFYPADLKKYKMLELAYQVIGMGNRHCILYFIANEIAVDMFIKNQIKFQDIAVVVEKCINYDYHDVELINIQDIMHFYIVNYSLLLNFLMHDFNI